MRSAWSGGTCEVRGARLSYTEAASGRSSSLTLDTGVIPPVSRLMCSERYTVIMESRAAVISLGAAGVLGNLESLGCYGGSGLSCEGGRFVAANSVEADLSGIEREDGGRASERIDGENLIVRSRSGRNWSLSLEDPFAGWSIY